MTTSYGISTDAHASRHATGGADAITLASIGAVPTTRTVNGKALSADIALAVADISGAAPLASPALTGTPTVPTAAGGTNTTQAASTAFVAAAIAALINSAPGALDTLNELAAAIGDDANYAATVTNALALKAPLASPTFTGTVAGITKAMVGLGSVDNTADSTKSVLSATKLTTARTVAGVSFDGTANIAIPLSGLTGTASLAQLPAGASIHVVSADGGTTWTDLSGATISARPTSRTDVRVIFETSGSTLPAWAITGDLLFKIGT